MIFFTIFYNWQTILNPIKVWKNIKKLPTKEKDDEKEKKKNYKIREKDDRKKKNCRRKNMKRKDKWKYLKKNCRRREKDDEKKQYRRKGKEKRWPKRREEDDKEVHTWNFFKKLLNS